MICVCVVNLRVRNLSEVLTFIPSTSHSYLNFFPPPSQVTVHPIPAPVLALLCPSLSRSTQRRLSFEKKKDKSESGLKEKAGDHKEGAVGDMVDLSLLPPHFLTRLHSFQLEGVSFALRRGGRVLICDEMGLGLLPISSYLSPIF